jgi:GNAT superfamily N-acetyltransferase
VVQRAVIRPRRDGDVPVLADVLTEQQPVSRYPFRWPLSFPVESFLVRDHEQAAWVAELDGTVVGHVMVGSVELELSSAVFRGRTGCAEPAVVSVKFVGSAVRGRGVGGLLLDTAVAWARERGRVPVLDVVPLPATALGFYQHRGWVEIGCRWVDWLTADQPHVLSLALPPFEAGR